MNQNENRFTYYPQGTHGRGYKITMSLLWCILYIGIFIAFQFLTTIIFSFGASFKVMVSALLKGNALTDSDIDAIQNMITDGILSASNAVSIVSGLCTLITVLLITELRTRNIPRALEIKKIHPISVIVLIVFAIGLSMAVLLFLSFIPFPDSWKGSYDDSVSMISEGNAVVSFISTVIMAPILEEVVFRALAYKMLRRTMPKIVAMSIVSLIFGALHGTIVWFIYAFIIGMILSWLFERFRSILANTIVHITFNLVGSNTDLLEKVNPTVVKVLCVFFLLALIPCTLYIVNMTARPDFISLPPLDIRDEYTPDDEKAFGFDNSDNGGNGNNGCNGGNGNNGGNGGNGANGGNGNGANGNNGGNVGNGGNGNNGFNSGNNNSGSSGGSDLLDFFR
ncbi:MAG: CPBP family intramembrane glutamic endopeptidase [Eubacteriales bacterium]|nr:CPBP family intramembrane glutamic endopeptidase [Eubacteriales bacterium]